LKNILLWTSFGKERKWANKIDLVGLFKIQWNTPCHNILVELLNNWKLDSKHNRIKAMMVQEQIIIDKHLLVEVFQIFHIGETKVNQAEMSNV
jgi:hypothetical protein